MNLKHKSPCSECPWRRESAQGWTGGYGAEVYADILMSHDIPECHKTPFGPDDSRTAYCVGALATSANQCKLPHDPQHVEAQRQIGRRDDCFGSVFEFHQYHEGLPYTIPMLR